MPGTELSGAEHVARALFESIAAEPLNLGVCSISITVSMSVTSLLPDREIDPGTLMNTGQEILLRVIESGGDRLVLAPQVEFASL